MGRIFYEFFYEGRYVNLSAEAKRFWRGSQIVKSACREGFNDKANLRL